LEFWKLVSVLQTGTRLRHHRAGAKRRIPVIPIEWPFPPWRDGRDNKPGHDAETQKPAARATGWTEFQLCYFGIYSTRANNPLISAGRREFLWISHAQTKEIT
jgi:hypothetical protein